MMDGLGKEHLPPWVAARERDPRRSTLFFIAIGLIGCAAGLLILASSLDEDKGFIGNPVTFSPPREAKPATTGHSAPLAPQVITEFATISGAPDPTALQGRQVALRHALVQAVPGDYTFWIGADAEHQVPVLLLGEETSRQTETQIQVRPGQRIEVFGIVRLLEESTAFASDKLLDEAERRRLARSRIYISATRVEILSAGE